MPPRKPPHPINRVRLRTYVSSKRVCHAISAAYSTDLNQRNLECDYYPAYNHTLSELADFEFDANGALTVREQYDLWLSKATLDLDQLPPDARDEAVEPMPAPILHPAPAAAFPPPSPSPPPPAAAAPAAPLDGTYWNIPSGTRISKPAPRSIRDWYASEEVRRILDDQSTLTAEEQLRAIKNLLSREAVVAEPADATEADTSTTTIDTVPDKNGKDEYPDLMLCHTQTVATARPNNPKKLYGWNRRMQRKVVHHCFPLILEVKACLDRAKQDDALEERASDALTEAEKELYEYMQTCFKRDACADSAIAMSAAGPYWRWIKVKREQISYDILAAPSKLEAMLKRFSTARIFTLGTKESDDELTRLRDKGLIPILETHHWYKSTLVPNPQR